MEFIISQILGGIALILVCISYFMDKKYFLIMQIFANLFYGSGFLVSSSFVAGLNTFVSIVRVLIYYLYERKEKDIPLFYTFIFSAIYITVGIIFYSGPWDILCMSTPIMFTFAMRIKKMITVNYAMLFPNILIFFYCICNRFYTSALLDLIEVSIIIVSIATYHIKKHNEKKNLTNENKNINNLNENEINKNKSTE